MHQLPSGNDQVVLEGDFEAFSRQELFDYWVTPTLLTQWWPKEAEVIPGKGGTYKFSWPSMGWVLEGKYLEFEPGEKLGFTWKWNHEPDRPGLYVELRFSDAPNGGTLLHIGQGTYTDSPQSQEDRQGHIEGWIHFCMLLAGLKEGIQDSKLTAS
jgi:uncharacterized protein YndB with AHSA1/START domain